MHTKITNHFERSAGEIRDPEIMGSLLLEDDMAGVHNQTIDKDSNKLISMFCKDVPTFINEINAIWVKLKPCLKKLKANDLDSYLKLTKKSIKSQQHPKLNMCQVHKSTKVNQDVYLSVRGKSTS